MNDDQFDSPNADSNIIQSLDLDNNSTCPKHKNYIGLSPFGDEFKAKLKTLRERVNKSKAQTEKALIESNTQRTRRNRYDKIINNKKLSSFVGLIENRQLNSRKITLIKENPIHLLEFRNNYQTKYSPQSYSNIYRKIQEISEHLNSRSKIANRINPITYSSISINSFSESQKQSQSHPNIFKSLTHQIQSTIPISIKSSTAFNKEYYQGELNSFSTRLFNKNHMKSSISMDFFTRDKQYNSYY